MDVPMAVKKYFDSLLRIANFQVLPYSIVILHRLSTQAKAFSFRILKKELKLDVTNILKWGFNVFEY